VAVVDVNEARAKEVAEVHGCEALIDHRALAGRADAASVAVPTVAHHRVAMDLLAAGIDVLVEKPIACTLAEADDLVRLAEERRAILQVGHVERQPASSRSGLRSVCRDSSNPPPGTTAGPRTSTVLDLMIHDSTSSRRSSRAIRHCGSRRRAIPSEQPTSPTRG
jgi:hypothetical protein